MKNIILTSLLDSVTNVAKLQNTVITEQQIAELKAEAAKNSCKVKVSVVLISDRPTSRMLDPDYNMTPGQSLIVSHTSVSVYSQIMAYIDIFAYETTDDIDTRQQMALNKRGTTMLTLNKRKNDYGEYVVKSYKDGKYDENSTYYTDDWEDAVGTLTDIANRLSLTIEINGNKYCAR